MGEEACDNVGDPVVSDSNEIPGIVSSKSNNSSTRQFVLHIKNYRPRILLLWDLDWQVSR